MNLIGIIWLYRYFGLPSIDLTILKFPFSFFNAITTIRSMLNSVDTETGKLLKRKH